MVIIMAIKQLSIFVENKPGKLLDIVKALADAKVNIRAMSIADTKDFGILRLIVPTQTKQRNSFQWFRCRRYTGYCRWNEW